MKKLILLSAVCCCWMSCDKNRNKQYSTWYINGESFYSRDVVFATSKGGNNLTKTGTDNGFSLGSGLTSAPQPGYLGISIDAVSHNPALFRVHFYQNGAGYQLSSHNPDSVLASYVNGKLRYEMPAAWFVNYTDPTDSVLISGTFNEP